MKKLLLLPVMLFSIGSFGQALKFDKGMLVSFPSVHISKANAPKVAKPQLNNKITDKDVKAIKALLLPAVEQGIRNLNNDSLGLKKFYSRLWDEAYVTELECDLKQLYNVLTGRRPSTNGCNFRYVPNATDLNNSLFDTSTILAFTLPEKEEADENKLVYKLFKNDVYKQWIVSRYNKKGTPQNWDDISYRIAYEKGWRDIEWAYSNLLNTRKTLTDTFIDGRCEGVQEKAATALVETERMLDTNHAVTHFTTNTFYKEWMWYTGGILTTNPFFITDAGRQYPIGEKYTFLTDSVRKVIKANKENTEALLRTKSLYNIVELPYTSTEYRERKELWHILAGRKYADNDLHNRTRLLAEDDEIKLCVHNVRLGVDLSVKFDTVVISDKGPVTDGLSAAADTLGNAISLLAGVSGTIKTISAGWADIKSIKKPVVESVVRSSNNVMNAKVYSYSDDMIGTTKMMFDVIPENLSPLGDSIVVVDDIPYKLKGDDESDKRFLITRFLYYNDTIVVGNNVIQKFLDNDLRKYANRLEYASIFELQESVNAFFDRFIQRLNDVSTCTGISKGLVSEIDKTLTYMNKLLHIHDRSLPPQLLNAEPAGETPAYNTRIVDMPIVARKQISYDVKLVEKKKIGDKDTTITTTVFYDKYKIGGKYLFIPSAGIAYTYPDYVNNEITLDDKNKISKIENNNQRIMVTVGLHIYPGKFYSLDNRSVFKTLRSKENGGGGFRHRVSIYAGIGISQGKALEHFFVGPSVDIYPGLKLITGIHAYKNTRYEIYNNQVTGQNTAMGITGFSSLNLDPVVFAKLITNIFNTKL